MAHRRFHDSICLALALLPLVLLNGCTTDVTLASRDSPPDAQADSQVHTTGDVAVDEGVVPTISPQELAARIDADDAPLVLDVRSEGEYAAGHIPGAIHVPHNQFAERLGDLSIDPDDEVVVHCQSGGRAVSCMTTLRDAGFTQVYDLEGDFGEWRKLDLPVAKP